MSNMQNWFQKAVLLIILSMSAIHIGFAQTISSSSSKLMTNSEFQQWLQDNVIAPPPKKVVVVKNNSNKLGPLTYEESKRAMLNTAPKDRKPITDEEQIAFDTMMDQNVPLAPRQVVELRQ